MLLGPNLLFGRNVRHFDEPMVAIHLIWSGINAQLSKRGEFMSCGNGCL